MFSLPWAHVNMPSCAVGPRAPRPVCPAELSGIIFPHGHGEQERVWRDLPPSLRAYALRVRVLGIIDKTAEAVLALVYLC